MPPKPRLLTKSRFRMALECPTKLAYTGKPEFDDANAEDTFLKALADGGFQVQALARCHFPEGKEIESQDPDEAVRQTALALGAGDCVLFEAAFRFERLYVRADVVVLKGKSLRLIEIKAKSWDPEDEEPFYDKKRKKKGAFALKGLTRGIGSHVFDVAFQTHVVRSSYPSLTVEPVLYLPNKRAKAKQDGINQKFLVRRGADGRPIVETKRDGIDANFGKNLFSEIPLTEQVDRLLAQKTFGLARHYEGGSLTFPQLVTQLADAYDADQKIPPVLGTQCKSCQFVSKNPEKSGFDQCWKEARLKRPNGTPVTELWQGNADKLIADGRYFLEQLEEHEFSDGSYGRRQWQQVSALKQKITAPMIDEPLLRKIVNSFRFPLHFIDFETATAALPFHAGRTPYEPVAFQFSHHVLHADGKLEHRTQWLGAQPGYFPNFDFVRALRKALSTEEGTIFRYTPHETRVLDTIARQLQGSDMREVPDRDELCQWIREVSDGGPREMVDMWEVWKMCIYHPHTGGSNSLKRVLPAILATAPYLREKWGKPIYQSENFPTPHQWVHVEADGSVRDPYADLPPLFSADDTKELERLFPQSELANGGSAMTAYARLQFEEMKKEERQAVEAALLRYCELDTLAMVFLYEVFVEESKKKKKS